MSAILCLSGRLRATLQFDRTIPRTGATGILDDLHVVHSCAITRLVVLRHGSRTADGRPRISVGGTLQVPPLRCAHSMATAAAAAPALDLLRARKARHSRRAATALVASP